VRVDSPFSLTRGVSDPGCGCEPRFMGSAWGGGAQGTSGTKPASSSTRRLRAHHRTPPAVALDMTLSSSCLPRRWLSTLTFEAQADLS